MDPIVMLGIAAAVVALPFVLMVLFNAGDRADSAGRRTNQRWRVGEEARRPRSTRPAATDEDDPSMPPNPTP